MFLIKNDRAALPRHLQLFPHEATAQRVLELYDERIAKIAIDADALTNQDALLYDSDSRALHEVTCNRLRQQCVRARTTDSDTSTNGKNGGQSATAYKYELKKQRAEGTTTTQAPCTDM
jgi:hypothetical protein